MRHKTKTTEAKNVNYRGEKDPNRKNLTGFACNIKIIQAINFRTVNAIP